MIMDFPTAGSVLIWILCAILQLSSALVSTSIAICAQCDLDRIPLDTSWAVFSSEYYLQKPVIIDTELDDWIANASFWNLEHLSESYLSTHSFKAADSLSLVFDEGRSSKQWTLKQYLRYVHRIQKNKKSEETRMFLFDYSVWNVMKQHDDTPIKLSSIPLFNVSADRMDYNIAFTTIAMNETGAAFHQHSEGWLFLISGQKRWFLYPPNITPPGGFWPGFSSNDWYNTVYPQLSDAQKPMECVQTEGQIIYIPEFWWHSELNIGLDIVIGTAVQHLGDGVYTPFMKWRARKDAINREIAEKQNVITNLEHDAMKYSIHRIYETLDQYSNGSNALNHFMRGYAMMEMRTQRDLWCHRAVAEFTNAIGLDPFYLEAYMTLGVLYGNHKLNAKYSQQKSMRERYCVDLDRAMNYFKKAYALNCKNHFLRSYFGSFLSGERAFERKHGNILQAVRAGSAII